MVQQCNDCHNCRPWKNEKGASRIGLAEKNYLFDLPLQMVLPSTQMATKCSQHRTGMYKINYYNIFAKLVQWDTL